MSQDSAGTLKRRAEPWHGLSAGGPRLILALIAIISTLLSVVSACGNPGEFVGDILSRLQGTVDSTIANAQNASNIELQQVGTQVQVTLDSAKSAMEDVLDKGYNDVNQTVQHSLDQLGQMVSDFQKQTAEMIHDSAMLAQQITNALPFTNKNPQVTTYDPIYASSKDLGSPTVPVTLHGNFVYAYEHGMHPHLSWPGGPGPIEGAAVTTQLLSFDVPATVFGQPGDNLHRISLDLEVPYQSGRVFKSIQPGHFTLGIFTLPASPVKILTLHDIKTVSTNSQPPPLQVNSRTEPTGDAWHVQSYQSCRNQDVTEGPIYASTTSDRHYFAIDYSSIGLNVSDPRKTGNHQVDIVNKTPNSFGVEIKTTANCILGVSKGSGDVYVTVSFRETYQPPTPPPVTTDTPIVEDITGLGWGGSVNRSVYSEKWVLDATMFDDTRLQYPSPETHNPYLNVTYLQASRAVSISVPSAQDLSKAAH